MSWSHFRRPSPALVVSTVALIVALGGTSYAAFSLPNNSVGNKQLKNGAVGGSKIANGAVNSSKIKNGAINTRKISNGAVTARQLNVTGVTVPNALHANSADAATNSTNATNALNSTNANNANNAATATALASVSYVRSASINSAACGTGPPCTAPSDTAGSVTCPTGTAAIGGGFGTSAAGLEINESEPETLVAGGPPNAWHGFVDNFTNTAHTFTVVVECIKANATVVSPANSISPKAADGRG
jgi:hypothetical protein